MNFSFTSLNVIKLTCKAQAICFFPIPFSYGIDLAIIPVPIIAAKETPNAINPPLATKFNRAGVRKTATALPAVSPIDAPKYAYVSLQTNLKIESSFGVITYFVLYAPPGVT